MGTLKNSRSAAVDAGEAGAPLLVRLLGGDRPEDPSWARSLAGFDEVRLARGAPAGLEEQGRTLLVRVDDPYASGRHAVLTCTARGVRVRDDGSTNGTWLDGARLRPGEERSAGEAGLLEVGHTFFLVRERAPGPVPQAQPGAEPLTLQPEWAQALAAAERLARGAHDLLVTGETGAGKEVLARFLHERSGRPGPLLAVNCAALAEPLLDDELFGHLKGAFSGAHADRQGLLRAAHQGTLLLDEIGDMPAPLQARLLRVLEEKRVRPLGSERSFPVDVRVIAASHRDLRALVAAGEFREDLLSRVGLLELRVPPVRERREDLGLLVRAVLREAAAGSGPVRFEHEALRALLLHPWPMNVRELRRVLLAAVDLGRHAEGALVRELDLKGLFSAPAAAPRAAPSAPLSEEDRLLRERLGGLLAEHGANVAAVARALGKPRTQVQRLMARLGLRRKR